MNEVIEGIELVKMYAWQRQMFKLIQEKREEEVKALKSIYTFLSFVRGFFEASVLISVICILIPYVIIT